MDDNEVILGEVSFHFSIKLKYIIYLIKLEGRGSRSLQKNDGYNANKKGWLDYWTLPHRTFMSFTLNKFKPDLDWFSTGRKTKDILFSFCFDRK